MSKNAKRRIAIFGAMIFICVVILIASNVFSDVLEPDSYNYYIENAASESDMPNAVAAIYLRYRLFDTLFETLLLAVSVSVVFYFAAPWEKDIKERDEAEDGL